MSATIRERKIRPGDEVAAPCGRCKGERTHQVVALNQTGTPAIVICSTCGSRHNYRAKREGASAATRARTVKEAAPVIRRNLRQYSPGEAYKEGEWIEHPKFGQGEITESREGKIEVKFGTEKRILIQTKQ